MALEVGTQAPDFTLQNQDGNPVTLRALAGNNVVLAFFPAAFTSVCTKEMCTFRDTLSQFNTVNARVFGISVDPPDKLKAFADAERLNFDLLSDADKQVIRKYDVVLPPKEIAKRAVYVIDGAGTIRYVEVTETPAVEPDYLKVHGALAAL
jgi:glutaredoxin-dependent peroxiredoxin